MMDQTAEFFSGNPPPYFPVPRVRRGVREEGPTNDPLAPARGLLVGAGLSVMLWCVIVPAIIGFMTLVHSMLAV